MAAPVAMALARQRAEWQGFAGMVRKACPGLARLDAAGMARSGRNGQAGRAWQARRPLVRIGMAGHGRHGFVGTAWPGQFWQARRGQAWKVRYGWLGVVGLGQGTAGKASWAPLAGHGRRSNKGMAGSGVAGPGPDWQAWRRRQDQAGNGRHGVARSGAIEARHRTAGMVRKAGIGRQGKAWPGQAWLARRDLARNVW